MNDESENVLNIQNSGGRPVDNWNYTRYSATINGQDFFFSGFSNTEETKRNGFYDLYIEDIGQKGFRDFSRIQFTDQQMNYIKGCINDYFKTHGQYSTENNPPRYVIFK